MIPSTKKILLKQPSNISVTGFRRVATRNHQGSLYSAASPIQLTCYVGILHVASRKLRSLKTGKRVVAYPDDQGSITRRKEWWEFCIIWRGFYQARASIDQITLCTGCRHFKTCGMREMFLVFCSIHTASNPPDWY